MSYTTIDDVRGEDRIDSRDLIDLLAELDASDDAEDHMANLTEDERELRAAILALADEVGGEWTYGAFLILEGSFEDYARELAEDIGAIKDDASWPYTCIDWPRAADELRMDYTSVSFLGHDYLVRA